MINKKVYLLIFIIILILCSFFVSGGDPPNNSGAGTQKVTQEAENTLKKVGTNPNIESAIKNSDGTFKVEGSYTDKYGNNIKGTFTIDSNGNIISAKDITIDRTNIKNAKNLKITKNSIKADNVGYIKGKNGKWTVKKAEEITTETEGSDPS